MLYLLDMLRYPQYYTQTCAQCFYRCVSRDIVMKSFFKAKNKFLLFAFCICAAFPCAAFGNDSPKMLQSVSYERKMNFARSFVAKMKANYLKSEAYLAETIYKDKIDENILPDGEMLLLQPILPENTRVDGVILGQVYNQKILVSLTDFANVLGLSIKVDPIKQTASGWYIRQNKEFFLDVQNKYVQTDVGRFDLTENVLFQENDILVPIIDLGQWIDFKFNPVVATQELKIEPSQSLPLQDRLRRRKLDTVSEKALPPSLPLKEEPYKAIAVPAVDVSTNTDYRRQGDAQTTRRADANIRTVGDLAYGTLTTQTSLNDKDKLRNMRVNYARQSVEPELLGPLKARKFEVGDVTTVRSGLGGEALQEFGVHVTNIDPLKVYSRPTTAISGYAFPGWDVELYRDTQMLGFEEVDENGYYNFEDVSLFASDNNFRLVFYGPQGERHEETLFIPIDQSRLSNSKGAYDVSLTFDGKQFYRKKDGFTDEDKGAPNLVALYEYPVLDATAVSAGFRSSEQDGERNNVASAGLSTTVQEALVNLELAVDDEGETAAELTARRSFGQHDINNTVRWTAPHFDTKNDGDNTEIGQIEETLRMIGPLPTPSFMGQQMRYNTSFGYQEDTEGNGAITASAGISGAYKKVSFNEQVDYQAGDNMDDDVLRSVSTVSSTYGRNNLRLQANYNIKPDSELSGVLASYRRNLTNKLDLNVEAEKRYQQSLTEFSAKLDWQAGFARISPRITYNTDREFFAGLSTRFGLLNDPRSSEMKFFDKNVSGTGGVSVFVFLDANGDGQFGEGDEPLEGVVVNAPQNGGREQTDEGGIALFSRMRDLLRTDISLDIDSLKDPTWVSGFDGVSIQPRNGYIATVDFPVHIGGELDGTIYMGRKVEGAGSPVDAEAAGNLPLRNINIALYNYKGEVEQSTVTDSGGFYYFSRIPPGRYFLIIDEKSADAGGFIRPMPQNIEIGYDGTVIYGRDLYVGGGADVPSEILANLDNYKTLYPDIDFTQEYDLVLNFGEYKSQLMMSLVWYKMRTKYSSVLAGGDLFVPPSKSIPEGAEGKHTLRVGLANSNIQDAYKRCRSMVARGQYCKVEIYPGYMKQAALDNHVAETVVD